MKKKIAKIKTNRKIVCIHILFALAFFSTQNCQKAQMCGDLDLSPTCRPFLFLSQAIGNKYGTHLFVSDSSSVLGYKINSETGQLSGLASSPFGASCSSYAMSIAPSLNRLFFYNMSGGTLDSLDISNPDTPTLAVDSTGWTSGNLRFSQNGKFLLQSGGGTTTSVYNYNSLNEALSLASGSPFGSGCSLGLIDFGSYLYEPLSNADTVNVYPFNTTTGVTGSASSYSDGTGVSFIKATIKHPILNVIYTAKNVSGLQNITAFNVNRSDGSLLQITGSPFALDTVNVATSSLAIRPQGDYLFAGSLTNIYTLAIDPADGSLTSLPAKKITLGANNLYSLQIDPSGKFLFVTTQTTFEINVIRISENGTLTHLSENTITTGSTSLGNIEILNATTPW